MKFMMSKSMQILLALVLGGLLGSATVNSKILNTLIVVLSRLIK